MRYVEPIVDRSAADVAARNYKAFMNVLDWVRIYNNIQAARALVSFLEGVGIDFTALATPTIFTIPTSAQINTLIENIQAVQEAARLPATELIMLQTWSSGSSATAPDYEDVNDWEQAIDYAYQLIGPAAEYQIYSGVSEAGQARHWQNRYRRITWVAATDPARKEKAGVAICGANLTKNKCFRRY